MIVSEFKKWASSVRDKYLTSKNYLRESKNDPPQEPYRSKYKAKEILEAILKELEDKWDKKENIQVSIAWGVLKYELAVIALETEEYSIGCDFLTECWEVLENYSLQPECCILVLNVLNQLGILWSGRSEPSKALEYLKDAEKIYLSYKENSSVCPHMLEHIFETERDDVNNGDWSSFEKIFTLTLYYLAQVYEHLNESEKSAKYCHKTLKRQQESGEYEEKEWSVNCATLSQYYIQEKFFITARHLLACAAFTVSRYESSIDNRVDDEDVWDDIHRSKAEVAWCWVKYCINLLECQGSSIDKKEESLEPEFKLSDDVQISEMESKVPIYISAFEDARKIFLFGQNQIKEAKLYYTLGSHANNHVQLVQDHSKLYKYLIRYEPNLPRCCKMHKRRIDMLQNILSELNPQYYLAVCRQLRFELGETYYELIDIKLKILSPSVDQSLAQTKKMNSLILNSIDHFKGFIESLKNREGCLPDSYSDDLVRPALIGHFYLGGLTSKLNESEVGKTLHNLTQSEEHYKYIMDYVEKNPDHASHVDKELPVIKQMVQLMPERKMIIGGSTIF